MWYCCRTVLKALAFPPTPQPTAFVEETFTFCGSSGPPTGLRVTSGSVSFGVTDGNGETCLANPTDTERPNRIETLGNDLGAVWMNPRISLTYSQTRFHRDVKVCGRVVSDSTTSFMVDDGMLDANAGVSNISNTLSLHHHIYLCTCLLLIYISMLLFSSSSIAVTWTPSRWHRHS